MSYKDSNEKVWVAKSYDFSNGSGYVFINKKNIRKKSFTLDWSFGKSWIAKYGSVTFNQAARNFPFSGMNSEGLNMEIMWLDSTRYPEETNGSTINESQIIQYVLDSAASTEEAIALISDISIVPIMAPVHYMVCDKTDDCRAVEYLRGELVVTKMGEGSEKFLQNSKYEDMKDWLTTSGHSERESSEDVKRIFSNDEYSTEESFVTKSFENLEMVRQGTWTKWQIVYNLEDQKIWFRTTEKENIRSLDLSDYELDCRKERETLVLNLSTDDEGDIKDLVRPFTGEVDDYLLQSFEGVPGILRTTVGLYSSMNHRCEKNKKFKKK